MENVYLAPKGYQRDDGNPFTKEGGYGRAWTILILDENAEWEMFQCKSKRGCYTVSLSPRSEYFRTRFADFIQYETAKGRKIILSSKRAYSLDFSTHYLETTIRPSDAPLLVHSTMLESYDQIVKDGCLKSVTRLRKEGYSVHPVGLAPLGEPEDYLDYIMLADQGLAPEFVINARLTGTITCDPDEPYTPQARLYFDGHKLVRDGLITRSLGSKVDDQLPLDPYLIATVTADVLPWPEGSSTWTPYLFARAADAWVAEMIQDRQDKITANTGTDP